MRYLIAFVAVVCFAGNAFASAPIKGTTVKGGKNTDTMITNQTAPNCASTSGNKGVKQKAWLCSNFRTTKTDPDSAPGGNTAPGTCDHAISTKGTGCAGRETHPDGTNPKDTLRTRTKSNQSNE